MTEEANRLAFKSEAMENYLKTIYHVVASGADPSVQEISTRLGVSPPAVSKMLRHLAQHHLVTYTPYHPVGLTVLGEKIALEVIRHHRLLEVYLMQTLGYDWEQVHAEAERLEHHISEEFEETIDRLLGHPQVDPHGDPIPTREGNISPTWTTALDALPIGEKVVVRRVSDENPDLLRYFSERGLRPGAVIEFIDREPFGGSLHVKVGARDERISPQAARHLFVEREVQRAS